MDSNANQNPVLVKTPEADDLAGILFASADLLSSACIIHSRAPQPGNYGIAAPFEREAYL